MPIYEYECEKCGRKTEKLIRKAGDALRSCPECGGDVERLISPPMIQFKGTGWYITDYQNKDKNRRKDDDSSKSASVPVDKKKTETKKTVEAKAG